MQDSMPNSQFYTGMLARIPTPALSTWYHADYREEEEEDY